VRVPGSWDGRRKGKAKVKIDAEGEGIKEKALRKGANQR